MANIGARNKTTYKPRSKLMDISPGEIVYVCDLFNEAEEADVLIKRPPSSSARRALDSDDDDDDSE